jgi:hypothetical protein
MESISKTKMKVEHRKNRQYTVICIAEKNKNRMCNALNNLTKPNRIQVIGQTA